MRLRRKGTPLARQVMACFCRQVMKKGCIASLRGRWAPSKKGASMIKPYNRSYGRREMRSPFGGFATTFAPVGYNGPRNLDHEFYI